MTVLKTVIQNVMMPVCRKRKPAYRHRKHLRVSTAPSTQAPTTIHIPTIGSIITLAQPWEFWLYAEHRNSALWKLISTQPIRYSNALPRERVALPPGTILKIDRIYLRKGLAGFDSVSFWASFPKGSAIAPGVPAPTAARFWAKLRDVNTIVGTLSPPDRIDPNAVVATSDGSLIGIVLKTSKEKVTLLPVRGTMRGKTIARGALVSIGYILEPYMQETGVVIGDDDTPVETLQINQAWMGPRDRVVEEIVKWMQANEQKWFPLALKAIATSTGVPLVQQAA